MAKKPPAFQFYVKDWLTSKAVLAMTPAQCGYYINLLANAWDSEPQGTLPNDPDLLWRMARAVSKNSFEKESALVLSQFTVMPNGTLANKRLMAERSAQRRRKSEKSMAGRLGAMARWGKNESTTTNKDNNLHGSATVLPLAENSSSSAFAFASASSSANQDQSQHPAQGPRGTKTDGERERMQRRNHLAKTDRVMEEVAVVKESMAGCGPSDEIHVQRSLQKIANKMDSLQPLSRAELEQRRQKQKLTLAAKFPKTVQ